MQRLTEVRKVIFKLSIIFASQIIFRSEFGLRNFTSGQNGLATEFQILVVYQKRIYHYRLISNTGAKITNECLWDHVHVVYLSDTTKAWT